MSSEANGNNEGVAAGVRVTKFLQWLMALPSEFSAKVMDVMSQSQLKKGGKEDPRRVIHALKVALSITLVTAFYYVKPLYNDFGSSAMYAVLSVGATLGKGLNRRFAMFSAGALGLGSYYLVNSISKEHIVEPILLGTLIYLITAGITYFRFLPQIKARYDYGLLVFSLTFCLVSVSSYRDHEVLDIALKKANLARWEPCHGRFRFRHPWQQNLKIGNLSRRCAYRIDALNGFLNSEKTPIEIRGKIAESCIKMSTEAGKALNELAVAIHKMIPPSVADPYIDKSKIAATNLRSIMKTGLLEDTNLFEVNPLLTVASLLVDVVSFTERLAESIQDLSTLAKFKNKDGKVVAEHPHEEESLQPCSNNSGAQHVIITINQPSLNLSHSGNS